MPRIFPLLSSVIRADEKTLSILVHNLLHFVLLIFLLLPHMLPSVLQLRQLLLQPLCPQDTNPELSTVAMFSLSLVHVMLLFEDVVGFNCNVFPIFISAVVLSKLKVTFLGTSIEYIRYS